MPTPRLAEPLESRVLFSTVTVAAPTVQEGAGVVQLTATLDAPAASDVTVGYRTVSQTARAHRDFGAERSSVVIPAGQTSATFDVLIGQGEAYEPEETFAVALRASPGTTLAARRVVVTVVDDDPAPTVEVVFSDRDGRVTEGEPGGATLLTATLRISNHQERAVRVTYWTVDGTATAAGGDYRATRGVVTFRAFEVLPATVKLFVLDDNREEAEESFALRFATTSAGVTIDPPSIDVGVFDDDSPLGVVPSVSVVAFDPEVEGTPGVSHEPGPPGPPVTSTPPSRGAFVVKLSVPDGAPLPRVPVSVAYATADGTATAGVDYQPASGVLTFAPGETSKSVFADPIADADAEPEETLTLTLSDPVNCAIVDGLATMTIPNDDGDVDPVSRPLP